MEVPQVVKERWIKPEESVLSDQPVYFAEGRYFLDRREGRLAGEMRMYLAELMFFLVEVSPARTADGPRKTVVVAIPKSELVPPNDSTSVSEMVDVNWHRSDSLQTLYWRFEGLKSGPFSFHHLDDLALELSRLITPQGVQQQEWLVLDNRPRLYPQAPKPNFTAYMAYWKLPETLRFADGPKVSVKSE